MTAVFNKVAHGHFAHNTAQTYDVSVRTLAEADPHAFAGATHELVVSTEGMEDLVAQAYFPAGGDPKAWGEVAADVIDRELPDPQQEWEREGAFVLVIWALDSGARKAELGRGG